MASKRKFSSLWMHFTDDSGSKKAKCKHCSTFISYAGGSNGNMKRHMTTKHGLIPLEIERLPSIAEVQQNVLTPDNPENVSSASAPSSSTSASAAAPSQRQQTMTQFVQKPPPKRKIQEIDRQVIKMVAKGHHALRIVDEVELRKLLEMVSHCPGYQLPSRKTLSLNILSTVHNEVLMNMKAKIDAVVALCLTTDAWTSSNNESYIAVTAHYIDAETRLCSALLACIAYDDRHTSQNLCNFLKDTMIEWNITHKVAAVVSDNTANIIAAVRLGEWRSIGCFAHLLNLVVQDATKGISDLLVQVKKIVEYFNRSTQGQKRLAATQEQMGLPVLKLKQDVCTRWNSTYDMLERILKVKDAVIATTALLRPDLTLTEEHWKLISEVLPLLKPFYEVTVEISAEKNVTLSKVIVFCNLIQNFLNKYKPETEKITAVQAVLKNGMANRFKDFENNLLYAECTILDPRFKQRGFKNKTAYETAIRGLRIKIGRVQLQQNEQEAVPTVTSVPSSHTSSTTEIENVCTSIWDEYDAETNKITKPENKTAAGIRELDKYLNEEYLGRKEDPLQWWQMRRKIYPHLYAYILKRFCMVATSVPCERVFSATGQILNQRRTLLKPNKVSKLIFLHSNM